MYKWVVEKMKQCIPCVQKRGASNLPKTPLRPIPPPSGVMARVHIDVTGGFVDVTPVENLH